MELHFNFRKQTSVMLLITYYYILVVCFVLSDAVPFPPTKEVDALREIAKELHKEDWDFSLNPCDNNTNWVTPASYDHGFLFVNQVYCNCTPVECHVIDIILSGQNLSGVVPPSLANLPYIRNIDLTNNYLSGTIPPQWTSTKLQILYVGGNLLSGSIPDYLGDITTLTHLILEDNIFSGDVPPSLGNLVNLRYLALTNNNLTGELSTELYRLTQLTGLILSWNNFVGKLPDFNSNWVKLEILAIEGNGFEGPIPSNLSLLNNLTDLRISDLKGGYSRFPHLKNMKNLEALVLRNCNISDTIPNYILNMTNLIILDLSFNNLHGDPPYFGVIYGLRFLYLTNNDLSGSIPTWAERPSMELMAADLSYNNFSECSFTPPCRSNVNLFRSITGKDNLGPSKCLTSCTKTWYSVHINCGGKEVKAYGKTYEADEDSAGYANFVHDKENWGSSSSGYFYIYPEHSETDVLTAKNKSLLAEVTYNPELYVRARVSPLSLTYYGRCLANGTYTVKIHFAEITLTYNQILNVKRRRKFDIYIQDELVEKDFNIEERAGGINKAVIQVYKASVKNSILQIRFRSNDQGIASYYYYSLSDAQLTNYGSLVSAISVESDFHPPSDKLRNTIIISAVSSCVVTLAVMFLLWWNGYIGGRRSREQGHANITHTET